MNRITPTINNGNLLLLISETFCLAPQLNLRVAVPIIDEKDKVLPELIFDFKFKENSNGARGVSATHSPGRVQIELINFNNTSLMGFTKPLTLTAGGIPLTIFLISQALIEPQSPDKKVILMTLTIYQGNLDNEISAQEKTKIRRIK
jgi:hypothetical protein